MEVPERSNPAEKTPAERRIFREGHGCPEPTKEEIESTHEFTVSEAEAITKRLDPDDVVIIPGYPASTRALRGIKAKDLVYYVKTTNREPWMKITVLKKYISEEVYKPLDLSS